MLLQSFSSKLTARNARETAPFASVYSSYLDLLHRANALESKNNELEKLLIVIKHDTARDREAFFDDDVNSSNNQQRTSIFAAAMSGAEGKHIKQLKSKIELLQDQLNAKLCSDVESATTQLKNATELAELRQSEVTNKHKIGSLGESNVIFEEQLKKIEVSIVDEENLAPLVGTLRRVATQPPCPLLVCRGPGGAPRQFVRRS